MSYAVLFPGQGTQHPGMLPWLEADPACSNALGVMQSALGMHWRGVLDDIQQRSSNAFAQPLIVGTGLAAWSALAAHLVERPAVVAGYSVGELCAYACAGVMAHDTAIALASRRAACMDAAALGLNGGLMSVSGMTLGAVLAQCPGLDCAIHIATDHAIYASPVAELERCAAALSARGAVCKLLEVQVPSHSHWMAPAAAEFAQALQSQSLSRPFAPVALNATGAVSRNPDTLRAALSEQIASTVQWASCMDAVAEQGVACVIEVGAGATLSKMWNQRHPAIPARSLEEFRDAAGAARWVHRTCSKN